MSIVENPRVWHRRPGVRPYVAAFVMDTAASAMFFVALAWVIVHSTDSAWVTAALLGLDRKSVV